MFHYISKPSDIKEVLAENIVPGMILAEGIVIDVDAESTRGVVFFHTPQGTPHERAGRKVQVYAQISSQHMVEVVQRTYKDRV